MSPWHTGEPSQKPTAGEVATPMIDGSQTPSHSNDWVGAVGFALTALFCFQVSNVQLAFVGSFLFGAIAVGHLVSWSKSWSKVWRILGAAVVLAVALLFLAQFISYSAARASRVTTKSPAESVPPVR